MSKTNRKASAEAFLSAMNLAPEPEQPRAARAPVSRAPKLEKPEEARPSLSAAARSRAEAGKKHIGAYLDAETVERFAVLRARLRLDNSALVKLAIDQLFQRVEADRKFGE
jgi:hypothetical protein